MAEGGGKQGSYLCPVHPPVHAAKGNTISDLVICLIVFPVSQLTSETVFLHCRDLGSHTKIYPQP